MTDKLIKNIDPRAALWFTATLDRPSPEPISAGTDAVCALVLAVVFLCAAFGALDVMAALCCFGASALCVFAAHVWNREGSRT